MKIQAAQRIRASQIVKDGYSEEQGTKELARLTEYKKERPHSCELLGAKGELHFYKFGGGPYGGVDIVCMVDDTAVGTIHLSRHSLEIEKDDKLKELSCVQPSSFMSKPYRGKGITFGMYQWIISQYNLVTDEKQSRDSQLLWRRLAKMYPAIVLTKAHAYKPIYREDPEAKLTLKSTIMLIMRHP